VLDAELCGDVSRLDGMGDARLAAEAKAIAYRLDPQAVVDRAARAETERTVTIRPGLCEACNYAKEADGWSVTADGGGTGVHSTEFTTPTGARYRSTAPPVLPGRWIRARLAGVRAA